MPADRSNLFPPDHYEAIGRLVIACIRLDVVLTELICGITRMDPDDALITVHSLRFDSKSETLKRLAASRSGDKLLEELVSLMSKAKTLYGYRNRLVHDAWTVGDRGTSPVTIQIVAHGTRRDRRHRPTKEIRARADEAVVLADRLEALAAYYG